MDQKSSEKGFKHLKTKAKGGNFQQQKKINKSSQFQFINTWKKASLLRRRRKTPFEDFKG